MRFRGPDGPKGQRRNYAETTIGSYIRIVEDFSRRFQRPPDRLGPQHIREYQSELFRKRKLAASTVTVYLAALRFFYTKTLKKSWSAAETPYPKRAEHIPSILSQQEVARLIDAADNSFHRTLLMTLYATGVRRAELTHLKISDVDSQRMVIHVQGGKGRKDRDVMLSPKLLKELRTAKAKPVAVSGQSPTYRRSTDFYESGLACLPECRQASRHQKTGASPYAEALLCYASAGTGCGSSQHPDAVRP